MPGRPRRPARALASASRGTLPAGPGGLKAYLTCARWLQMVRRLGAGYSRGVSRPEPGPGFSKQRLVALCCVWLAFGACSPITRVRECRRIVDTVNPRLDRAEILAQDAGTPEQYEQIAAVYKEMGQALTGLPIGDPKLKQAAEEYRGLTEVTARQSESMAKALDRQNDGGRKQRKQLRQLRAQARRHVATQDAVVRNLNELCHPK
jgi:hypothetical protein